MALTFIHAADFHLGADLTRFGAAAKKVAGAQLNALEKTLTYAADYKASFVLICGDFFDSRNPARNKIQSADEIFRRYPGIKIYVIPGTHDFLGEGSIYAESLQIWTADNVIILNESRTSPHHVPEADVYLYFRHNRSNRSQLSPIAGLVRLKQDGYHIAMAHGSLKTGGFEFSDDHPIDPYEIEKSGMDYLALGHWHRNKNESYGRTIAAYAGTPQPLSFSDPGEGSVNCVTINREKKPVIDPLGTSTISFRRIVAHLYHPHELRKILNKAADPRVIVKLCLSFSDKFTESREVDEIIANFESRFLLVQSGSQNRHNADSIRGIDSQTEDSPLISAFLDELERLRKSDSPQRAGVYDSASELGLRIIRGDD
jgi:DNA repair exonuclease SbcCD nuclease subunit